MDNQVSTLHNHRQQFLVCSSLEDVERLREQSIEQLYYFTARGLALGSVPLTIGNFINLTHLDLSYCGLLTLPVEIGNLVKLESLYANGNPFISLPTTLIKLVNLQYLELRVDDDSSVPSILVAHGKLPCQRTKDYLQAIYDYYSKPAKDATYQFTVIGRQHYLPKDMLKMIGHLILDSRDDIAWHQRKRIDQPIIPNPPVQARLICSSDDAPDWCI